MIDNVDTEVEQIFAVLLLRGDEGADVQFQLVEHGFVHNTVAVDEMAEEAVFLDGGKVLFETSKLRVPLGLACIVYMMFNV